MVISIGRMCSSYWNETDAVMVEKIIVDFPLLLENRRQAIKKSMDENIRQQE